jgi:hypothetical protein
LLKGTRARVADRAASVTDSQEIDMQSVLRALATQHVDEMHGAEFDFRGLSVGELADVASKVGLKVRAVETPRSDEAAVDQLRDDLRANLGRVIVNFSRPQLEQEGAGHHSVVVAYHAGSDAFLIDDPASFKLPPFWVSAAELSRAMATFDATPGVGRYRGYVIVEGEGLLDDPSEDLSASVVLRPSRPRG